MPGQTELSMACCPQYQDVFPVVKRSNYYDVVNTVDSTIIMSI